ncbi:hypothetical protein ACGYK3_18300, partial [Sulfitobacter sp. 1A05707]|uniref:hypothetical protein n=1 Tax=Sulfitobacter sp. 1A05707 TaxID=3368560 RepID=UPI0037467E93
NKKTWTSFFGGHGGAAPPGGRSVTGQEHRMKPSGSTQTNRISKKNCASSLAEKLRARRPKWRRFNTLGRNIAS